MDVSIVSPEKKVWSGDAEMVVARSPEGEFAILRGHIPFLAALVPGAVKVRTSDGHQVFLVTGGVLEASGSRDDYHVIVLADDTENAKSIDLADARRRLEDARKRSDDLSEADLRVAMARVEIAESQSS